MARRKPTTITISAEELRTGDYIRGRGLVNHVAVGKVVVAFIKNDPAILDNDEQLVVHLEDYGTEGAP